METATGSDLDLTSREIHRVVLELAESLDEDQLRWRPDGYATSVGFHLWHLARESHSSATTVGTGLTDEVAATLPIPAKAEVLAYLRRSYADLEAFVTLVDERFPTADGLDPAFATRVGRIRLNVLNFLTHDCRHLGMMEVLKGLQTGFGSATETRP